MCVNYRFNMYAYIGISWLHKGQAQSIRFVSLVDLSLKIDETISKSLTYLSYKEDVFHVSRFIIECKPPPPSTTTITIIFLSLMLFPVLSMHFDLFSTSDTGW